MSSFSEGFPVHIIIIHAALHESTHSSIGPVRLNVVPHCDEHPGAVEIDTLHVSDERADFQFDGRHVVAGTLVCGVVDISTLVDGKVFPKWCH